MSNVDSPCQRQCALNNDNVCTACFRSLNEIAHWSKANDSEKIEILALSLDRQKRLKRD